MNDKLKIKIPIANRVYPMIIEPSKEQGLRLASQKINNLIKRNISVNSFFNVV